MKSYLALSSDKSVNPHWAVVYLSAMRLFSLCNFTHHQNKTSFPSIIVKNRDHFLFICIMLLWFGNTNPVDTNEILTDTYLRAVTFHAEAVQESCRNHAGVRRNV